jgi:hypothetical protein
MSIIVSVKINDGVVMAADSATTFFKSTGEAGQIYEHGNKIVNLVKGLPIGVMTCGAGGLGNASIVTLLKDLRMRLSADRDDWKVDHANYAMDAIAQRAHEFFVAKAAETDFKGFLMLRICGYSTGQPAPETWDIMFTQGNCPDPVCKQAKEHFGLLWDGEFEALNRSDPRDT